MMIITIVDYGGIDCNKACVRMFFSCVHAVCLVWCMCVVFVLGSHVVGVCLVCAKVCLMCLVCEGVSGVWRCGLKRRQGMRQMTTPYMTP